MTILCDRDLRTLMENGLINEPDYSLLNPASIDVRIGSQIIREVSYGNFEAHNIYKGWARIKPGEFILAETMENFNVPNGYAVELRLKSTAARQGWNHALAVWVDPCWQGVLTLEIKNSLQYNALTLSFGQRFAQAIVHKLSGPSEKPYSGKYQSAQGVEGPKE